MDELVRSLLADLAHDLDRLADELERDRPALARTLRLESRRVEPEDMGAAEARPRRRRLRPSLYRALDAGAVDARRFDRLMLLGARVEAQRR